MYVENFMTEAEGGVPIYARVRLDEYMELGAGAGLKTGDNGFDSKAATSLVGGANIDDVTTWKTHIPGDTIEGGTQMTRSIPTGNGQPAGKLHICLPSIKTRIRWLPTSTAPTKVPTRTTMSTTTIIQ